MGTLGRYLVLTAKAKTGFSPAILILLALAAITGIAALVLLCVTIYVLLAALLGPLWAAAALFAFFFLLTIILIIAAIQVRKSTMARAKAAMASRSTHALFDTSVLTLGLEIGRTIGWRRIVPIAAIAMIAAGVAREWAKRGTPKDDA